MAHIILLGDSVFDNLKYVQPEPDVLAQMRSVSRQIGELSDHVVGNSSVHSPKACLPTAWEYLPQVWSLVSAEMIYLVLLETCFGRLFP